MRLKPRSTTRNQRALLYRRYTAIQSSIGAPTVYKTSDEKFWAFDEVRAEFVELPDTYDVFVPVGTTTFAYTNSLIDREKPVRLFVYSALGGWAYTQTTALNSAVSVDYAKSRAYQINRYYFVKSFDYMLSGSISGTTGQYIKGNIVPITSFNIKHFDDSVNLQVDDLVVIDKRLYSVENPEMEHKHQPRDYNIYFATLNNIL